MKVLDMINCVSMRGVNHLAIGSLFLLSLLGCQSYHTVDQVADKDELNRYLQHLWKKIETIADVRFPDLQKLIDTERRIDIEMDINRKGELVQLVLKKGSGNAELDTAVFDILRYAAPHPPLPDALQVDVLRISRSWMLVPEK